MDKSAEGGIAATGTLITDSLALLSLPNPLHFISAATDADLYSSGTQTFSRQGPLMGHKLDHGPCLIRFCPRVINPNLIGLSINFYVHAFE